MPTPLAASINLSILLQRAIEFHAPDSMSWAAWSVLIVIACVCLMLSAFVSGSEIAYFGLTPADIDDLRDEEDDPKCSRAYSLVKRSEQLLATILISNNLVNITMVVLMTFAINQTVTKSASGFLSLLFRLTAPLARVMVKSTGIVNRIVTKKQETISTDELEKALEISDMQEGKDKEMLEGILSFGEKEVCEIMIPRIDVTAIEYHDGYRQVLDTITTTGYSRIPVYDTSQDSIRGILYSKDLLPYIETCSDGFNWQKLLREPYYVPESRMIDDLLEDFRKRKMHMAIVVDEYGGTRGIVTLEDIIEEIVGQIDDEYDHEERMYKKVGPGTFVFDAKVPLGDFCHIVGVDDEELGDEVEAETLAGLLLEIKGDFPQPKETLERGRCRFLVLDMERHRITRVRVSVDDHQEKQGA